MSEGNKSTQVTDTAWGFRNSKIKQLDNDSEILGQISLTYMPFGDKTQNILIPREKKLTAEKRHQKKP